MINLDINLSILVLPNMFYGAGIFFAMTPLVPLSCSTLDNKELTNASCLQNLLKNTGGAIGTSISTTMVSRFAQMHQNMMVGHLNSLHDVYAEKLQTIAMNMSNYVDISTAYYMAQGQLYRELLRQANLWGYVETFRWFALATFLLIPLLLLIKKPKKIG